MSWRPTASWATLALRARMLATTRGFFAARGVTEVQTPVLQAHAVTDGHIHSIGAGRNTGHGGRWLHSSPEHAMKRLLAAGAPDIYQICPVFRDDEQGLRHQAEFTLIEWYRHGMALTALAEETCALVGTMAATAGTTLAPPRHFSYRALFEAHAGVDVLAADSDQLRDRAAVLLGTATLAALDGSLGDDRDAWLDLLMSHVIERALREVDLAVVSGYPASQAALARLDPGDPRLALRFEIYCRGIELANGYHELGDATEQAARFAADRAWRIGHGLADVEPDTRLLAALGHGLPDCAGVALGFDRAIMALLGETDIRQVMSFPAGG